jgi:ferrous iron transport protein A
MTLFDRTSTDRPATRLADLALGQSGVVARLEVEGEQRRRLMDLGLVPGTVVTAELKSPLRDPTAYRIRGALIALRSDQAGLVVLEDTNENATAESEKEPEV